MEGSDALMAIAANPAALAYPGYRIAGRRLWRLLSWAAVGGPPDGREDHRGEPEPTVDRDPLEVQRTGIDMIAVCARNQHARLVVAGFAASTPSLGVLWEQVDRALADVPVLGSLLAGLTAELTGVRLDQASLVAAIRAALSAQADGADDPLSHLRDELASQPGHRGPSGGDRHDA
jgi:hypothetical protein